MFHLPSEFDAIDLYLSRFALNQFQWVAACVRYHQIKNPMIGQQHPNINDEKCSTHYCLMFQTHWRISFSIDTNIERKCEREKKT